MSWREIAEVCYIRYGRKPSHHSVKHIATSGLLPSPQARRYQPWHLIADPAERKLAVIRLHSEGWSIVSPAICGRIMAANRQLYGLQRPPHSPPRPKLEMPFKAARRHEFWSADIRYIEEHLLPDPRPVYVITIFENFSRAVLSSAISASYKSANRCITLSWLQWLASS